LGGGYSLARLSRVDARTWRFEWTEKAKTQSSQVVESLKDAILEFRAARDGRLIYVLLRKLERRVDRPLDVWKNQQILFAKLESRIRPVDWALNPDVPEGIHVLEGTQWKPRIRRWKLVISRPENAAGDHDGPRRVVESTPAKAGDGAGGEVALERDLIPDEVKVRLTIDPSNPGAIDVHIVPEPGRVTAGREQRSARLDELKKATPKKDGEERDPLEYRRAELGKLSDKGATDPEQRKTLEREIADLESINRIREMEDLLAKPANVALSVVIGLDVDGPGILDIVRIGDFAGGP
jgi:hypothetical protein